MRIGPARNSTEDRALKELARDCGLQLSYEDAHHRRKEASLEGVRTVLSTLGELPRGGTAALKHRLAERREQRQRRWIEPVHVLWDGHPFHVPLRLPERSGAGPLQWRLREESGRTHEGRLTPDDLPVQAQGRGESCRVLPLPSELPWGYHDLQLNLGSESRSCKVFRAPVRTFDPSRNGSSEERCPWGVFLPLHALRTERTWGCGDYTALSEALEWLNQKKGQLFGLLPLYPSFYDGKLNDPSPYRPISRLFWNELFIDPRQAPGWEGAEELRRRAGEGDWAQVIRELRACDELDYTRLFFLKRHVLGETARAFARAPESEQKPFRDFLENSPQVRDYAAFRALYHRHPVSWQDWEPRLRQGNFEESDLDREERDFWLYAQWVAHRQLEPLVSRKGGKAPWLYLDLPVGVHPSGYDTWREGENYVLGASVGAPPDLFFTSGQNWGMNPLHPEHIRERGYDHVRRYMSHLMSQCRVVRLDHVMGLHRLYWIADRMEPSDGVYVKYRSEEMYAILTLESWRHHTQVIGEDLGTVARQIRLDMERHGLQRMYVLPVEIAEKKDRVFEPVPASAMATFNTHDMWPFPAFLKGTDIAQREELGLLKTGEAYEERRDREELKSRLKTWAQQRSHRFESQDEDEALMAACLDYLASSAAQTLILDLESLWGELFPQNVPGKEAYPSWRRKARYPLEQWDSLSPMTQWLNEVARIRAQKDTGEIPWRNHRETNGPEERPA